MTPEHQAALEKAIYEVTTQMVEQANRALADEDRRLAKEDDD